MATTITKADLANCLHEKSGLARQESKEIVQAFFEEISATLTSGKSVKIASFGNFSLRDKPTRPGRNPKTGESIPVTARRVVTFQASAMLKAKVEETGRVIEFKEAKAA